LKRGQLQLASADQVDELLTDGCTDRRLPKLVEQIEPLLTDQVVWTLIDVEQQQRLLAAAPRLVELCTRMAEYKVPPTLVHGDLDMPNIARRGEHFVFFDWSDACIAHPFVDTITILHEDDKAVAGAPARTVAVGRSHLRTPPGRQLSLSRSPCRNRVQSSDHSVGDTVLVWQAFGSALAQPLRPFNRKDHQEAQPTPLAG
jgi:hypothetical protein